MPAIYHEGSWLGNATDPEVLVKDTVGWTGKNRAYSQTNNAVIAHIESGITYDVSWTGSATVTLKKNSASGATIMSGSTSPLSFTADADYELYFGSSATVTNIMVKDSRITDPTYEPYHESVEEEIEQIYADNGVLGAKNLCSNPYNRATGATLSGVTITVNSDYSVTLNGTANANNGFDIHRRVPNNNETDLYLPEGNYILSSPDTQASNVTLEIATTKNGKYNSIVSSYVGKEIHFSISSQDSDYVKDGKILIGVYINFKNGDVFSNYTIYPLIRLPSDPDDTYQPYAMTNRELTEKKINIADLKTVVSASSDFADFKTRIASL